jgi:hypothetical protein
VKESHDKPSQAKIATERIKVKQSGEELQNFFQVKNDALKTLSASVIHLPSS